MKRRIWREGERWAAAVRRRTSAAEAHGFASWLQAAWWTTGVHQALRLRRGKRWANES